MMEPFDYPAMVRKSLRQVVRLALEEVAAYGFEEGRHLFITFRTAAPGVEIPRSLSDRFPDTMTIVLQHQFWDLEPQKEHFEVTLTFSGVHQRLVIPYAAIDTFVDPYAEFALSFEERELEAALGPSGVVDDADEDAEGEAETQPEADGATDSSTASEPQEEALRDVVQLDDFRKR